MDPQCHVGLRMNLYCYFDILKMYFFQLKIFKLLVIKNQDLDFDPDPHFD
jgi:hypothetical protein